MRHLVAAWAIGGVVLDTAHAAPPAADATTFTLTRAGEGRRHRSWFVAGLALTGTGLAVATIGLGDDLGVVTSGHRDDYWEGPLPGVAAYIPADILVLNGSIYAALAYAHETRTLRPYLRRRTGLGWAGVSLMLAGGAGMLVAPVVWSPEAEAAAVGVTTVGFVLAAVELARLSRAVDELPPDVHDQLYHRRSRVVVTVAPTFRVDGVGVALAGVF